MLTTHARTRTPTQANKKEESKKNVNWLIEVRRERKQQQNTHARTHARTHMRTHTHAHAHTHAHTRTERGRGMAHKHTASGNGVSGRMRKILSARRCLIDTSVFACCGQELCAHSGEFNHRQCTSRTVSGLTRLTKWGLHEFTKWGFTRIIY